MIFDVLSLVADVVVKINAAPALLVLDLHDVINVQGYKAIMKSGILSLRLEKVVKKIWKTLLLSKEGWTKTDLRRRQLTSFEKQRTFTIQQEKERVLKIGKDEKFALQQQMALEENSRRHLEDLKKKEKEMEEVSD